jgi:hypothetical protein
MEDGTSAVVTIDGPPKISGFNGSAVVFDVIRVVLCGTTAGVMEGIGRVAVVFDVLRVTFLGDATGRIVPALLSRVDTIVVG